LVIAIAVAGALLGEEATTGELTGRLSEPLGADAASLDSRLVGQLREQHASGVAATLSALFLAYAATRLFSALQAALNFVWGVRVRPDAHAGFHGRAWQILRRRLICFAMVLLFCLGMVVQLIVRASLTWISELLGGAGPSSLFGALDFGASLLVYFGMIVLVYRLLPDARIGWADVTRGAAVTAVLLAVGA